MARGYFEGCYFTAANTNTWMLASVRSVIHCDHMHSFPFGLVVSIVTVSPNPDASRLGNHIPVFHLQLCYGELLLIFSLKNIPIKNFQDASSVFISIYLYTYITKQTFQQCSLRCPKYFCKGKNLFGCQKVFSNPMQLLKQQTAEDLRQVISKL